MSQLSVSVADFRTPEKAASRVEICPFEAKHARILAEFFHDVWGAAGDAEGLLVARRQAAAANLAEPGSDVPTSIAIHEGRVVAYCTTLPILLWNGACDRPAYWIKGLMVRPEMRQGPLGYLVLKALAARVPRSLALAVAPAARRLFGALGYADLGPVPNFIQLLRGDRVLAKLNLAQLGAIGAWGAKARAISALQRMRLSRPGGWLAGAALGGLAGAVRLASGAVVRSVALHDGHLAPPDLNDLWRRSKGGLPAAVVRSDAYLTQRYRSGYQWVSVRKGRELTAAAIVRAPRDEGDPRLAGISLATLADLLVAPADRGGAVAALAGAARAARQWGADALIAMASHPAAVRALRGAGYLRIPGNVHLLLRDTTGEAGAWPATLDRWWLTRGDGEADGAL